jgi:inorganic pyrophosphatase
MNLYNIATHIDSPVIVNAIVEIPKGDSAKYEYDPTLEVFRLDRCLMSAMVYPASYGFIPDTLAEDGDALDIIIYNATPISRGSLVECKVIGCLDMQDDGVNDYKVLACPVSHVKDYVRIDDVDPVWLTVAENFFQHYKELDGKKVTTNGWLRREVTYDIINQSEIVV